MELDRDTLVLRFRDYISYNTRSDEENDKVCPSTPGQMVLAKHLKEELEELGLSDVTVDDNGYVMAALSANGEEGSTVGFISHMDTSPDAPGGPIHARIVKNYDGKDILLNKDKQIVLSVKDFPEIRKYEGQDIMVTDGTTLLGSDDKAGITAIVSAMEYLLHHPEVKHGKIRIAFTPDEETGRSPLKFDVKAFGADFAYTVDGGELGGLEYENFNAANPVVTIRGRSVHTGDAKGKMVNAISIASEWQDMLPEGEKPECTEGREGFFHVYKIRGTVEECTLDMLVRDHDSQKFQLRKDFLLSMVDFLNKKYGEGTVMVELNDVYFNMMDIIEKGHMDIVELARDAMKAAGVTPVELPIRGGTDGAQLSFKGLPCPNLFTGGANFHSRFEYLPLDSMEKACETVIEIARRAWKIGKK